MRTSPASAPEETTSGKLNKDFWIFWTGQTISNLGSTVSFFVFPLLIFTLTGSAINLAISTAVTYLPYLLFGLVIGAWVDRVNRKSLMIIIDLVRGLFIASIPALFVSHLLYVWWIYVVIFVNSTLAIAFNAAQFAAVPSLVGKSDLVTANGRIQASFSASSIIGPLLAGLLLAFIPIATVVLVDAISFFVSLISLLLIHTSFNEAPTRKTESKSLWEDVVEGLSYVWSNPVLRAISVMMALTNLVTTTINTQLVLFAKHQLAATDSQVGFLYSASGIGIVVLSLAAGPLRKRLPLSTVALGSLMLRGILLVLLAFMHLFWIAAGLWTITSGLGVLFNINTSSLRQAITPNQMLGRVMTIASVLAWSAIPIGTMLGGAAIQQTNNVALVYAAIGILAFLIPFCFSFTALGHAEQYLPEQKVVSQQ